jgi:tetratricopeptide (TPR) repeat protein
LTVGLLGTNIALLSRKRRLTRLRILDLATDVADDGSSSEETDSELNEKHSDEESPNSDNSITSPLKFQERSMRQYFRAMEVDEHGLRSSPSLGHSTIFEMAARILNTPDTTEAADGGLDIAWQLQDYAGAFWIQHFLDIDIEGATTDAVRTVIGSLFMIMNPEGEGLRNIESYTSGVDNRNIFGGAPYPLKEKFFEHFDIWLGRGRDLLKTDLHDFSNEVVAWLATCTSEEETLIHIAKGHVMNMYKVDRSWKVRQSLDFARSTLQQTRFASGISDDSAIDREHAEADILAVTAAFPEIGNTSEAFKAIGMAFYSLQSYALSLEYMKRSLAITKSDIERYHIHFWIGDVELPLSETMEDTDEQMEHVRSAYEAINASVTLYEENEEVKNFLHEKMYRRNVVQFNLTNKAICEIKLGEIDQAIVTMDQAYAALGEESDNSLNDDFVNSITTFLEKAGDFEKLLSVVERFKKWDIIQWLGFDSGTGHDRLQHAAWECKKQDFMTKIYETLIKDVDRYNLGARIRSNLAAAYQFVFPNYDEAKRLLNEILDGKKGTPWGDADEDFVFMTRLQLADVLVKQFKAATDPDLKTILHGEMKNLALQHTLAVSKDFNPYESQTMISLALMTGKMGPTNEFQTIMDKTFRGCIDALTDTLAGNDSQGFRLLSKALAFIPEMKRDAQIAYSLQFSIVDESLLSPPDNAEEEKPIDDTAVEGQAPEAEKVAVTDQAVPGTTTTPNSSAEVATEQLNPSGEIYCDGCGTHFSDWTQGPVYGCIICTNCDLCESCWTKIDRCNKGEPWSEWKSYCGHTHKYIKGPIVGWKGVNGGVLKFEYPANEGETIGRVEEIKFTDWLDGVQERWSEAWKEFWRKEDLVVDIL